jgi:hypothetical protein
MRIGKRLLLRLIAAEFSYRTEWRREHYQQVLFLQELKGLQAKLARTHRIRSLNTQ